MREFDIIVIGAGMAGASLGWRLAGQRSLLLLETEAQPGYHATGRSAAMFMESYGAPGVRALTRASRTFYEAPPDGFTDAALLAARGALYLATHEQADRLPAMRRSLADKAGEVVQLSADAALDLVPCLRPEVIHGALLERDARDIDVHALHQGFLRGMRRQGGVLQVQAMLASAHRDTRGWELRLADGEVLRAQVLVNAAGAWADGVALACGAQPAGVEPRRRSAFTFHAPADMQVADWPAVVGIDESWYFKPDAGRLLGSPANADPTFAHDVMPEELDVAIGIDRIEAVTTLQIRRPASTWAGLRSFARDGELVIGWDDGCPGFFWLAGQGGYGIQTAAGASALAASLLLREPLPDELHRHGVDPAAFDPRRLR